MTQAPAAPAGRTTRLPDLRYSSTEDELRSAVRALLADRSPWPSVLARTETQMPNDGALWHSLAAGQPGPEGSAAKIVFARLNQELAALELELSGADGLRYDDWTLRRPETVSFLTRGPSYRYLRARGHSIEGGTSEILRNIIAERVLGMPAEPRTDTSVPWKDLPR